MPVVHYKVKGTITRIYNEWSVVSNKVEMWIDKWWECQLKQSNGHSDGVELKRDYGDKA